jgi:hypothetical protein
MDLRTFLYLAPCVLLSLALHELAHAWVAWRLGDPTAKNQGRITFNPLKHLDPLDRDVRGHLAHAGPVRLGEARARHSGNFRRPKEGMAPSLLPVRHELPARAHRPRRRRLADSRARPPTSSVPSSSSTSSSAFNLIPSRRSTARILGVLMSDDTYRHWVRLDQYGMIIVLGSFFIFRDQFSTLLGSAFDAVESVMRVIVGA